MNPQTQPQSPHPPKRRSATPQMLLAAALATTLLTQPGCGKFLHNLKPHRLRMLNYNSSSGRDDVFFSVPDPLQQTPQNTQNAKPDQQRP